MTVSLAVLAFLHVIMPIHIVTPAQEQLRVAFTMKMDDYGEVIGPALLEPIQKVGEELNVDVNWTILDTNGSSVDIVSKFFNDIFSFRPHVIIGERKNECCDVMATLTSASDTLFISIACNPMLFVTDRLAYPTYASAKIATFRLGSIVDKVMKTFNWNRVAIVSTLDGVYKALFRSLTAELEQKKREFFSYSHAKSNSTLADFSLRENSIRIMLTYLAERATLFVLLMESMEVKFMLQLIKTMGLMNGEHAFLIQDCILSLDTKGVDMTHCEGLLSVDITRNRDIAEDREFREKIYSGFDSVEWKNHTDWKRAKFFVSKKGMTSTFKRQMQSAAVLYDSVLLWKNILSTAKEKHPNLGWETLAKQGNYLSSLSRDMIFEGITGRVFIKDGMRLANWTVSMMQNGSMKGILLYDDERRKFTDLKSGQLNWAGGSKTPPKEPRCFVDRCKGERDALLVVICCSLAAAVVAILITGVVIFVLWKRLQESQIISNWRIVWSDVFLLAEANTSANSSISDRRSIASSGVGRLFITAGMYKGTTIAIKLVPRDSVNIFEKSIYKELKQLLYVKHENINPFVGVCVDAPNVCVAMAYADKGSIQNVLADQQFDIDWEFRMSLALDVANGMEYLHNSPVGVHGHLTSANCVIDERWICRITDYGLKLFRCIDTLQRSSSDLLWTAPEILRKKYNDHVRVYGTRPGDVYSFGIIISELLTRELPYQSGAAAVTLEELLAKVKMSLEPPFRPSVPPMEGHIAGEWIALAKSCWQPSAQKRPTFRTVKSVLLANHSGKFTNVLERMQMVLEESIERANTDLLVERRKTEAMLESILPRSVVEKISSGTEFEPQLSDSVTLCLCDTIGFYKATNDLPAEVVVDVLKSMYQQYDEIVAKYGASEINSNGGNDSMMLAGGLPVNTKVDAEAICTMSLELLSFISTFKHPRIESRGIQMKTTIHTGSAYTAVMGRQMPQLHVFGEAVQTAMDLHTYGDNMTIRVSSSTRDLLPATSGFKIQKSEDVTYKESLVLMYIVTGKEGFAKPLPPPPTPSPAPSRKSSSVRRRSTAAKARK